MIFASKFTNLFQFEASKGGDLREPSFEVSVNC